MLQARFAMAKALEVPPGAFTPPPKVDSAVVRMRPLPEDRPRARDERLFAAIVAAAFSQRRKTLRNAARAFVPPQAYAAAGIDAGRRGETLSVAEFVALADAALAAGGTDGTVVKASCPSARASRIVRFLRARTK